MLLNKTVYKARMSHLSGEIFVTVDFSPYLLKAVGFFVSSVMNGILSARRYSRLIFMSVYYLGERMQVCADE